MPESIRDDEFVFACELPAPGFPISRRTAKRYREERRVPSYLIAGKIAFRRSELRRHIESSRMDALPSHELLRNAG